MIAKPSNEEEAAFAKEWNYRTPVGRYVEHPSAGPLRWAVQSDFYFGREEHDRTGR